MAIMQSLKFKIIAILVITMIALLAYQTFFIVPQIKEQQIADSIEMQAVVANQIAIDLNHSFRQAITELEAIAKLPGITSRAPALNAETISTMDKITPFFNYFFLMDKEGSWLSFPTRPQMVGTNVPSQNMGWVNSTFARQETIFLDVVLANVNKLVSGFATPVLSEDGTSDRLLRGVFLISEDNYLLSDLKKTNVGKNGFAFLVSANGWVLAHPNLKQSPEKFTVYDYSAFPPVKNVIAGKSGHLEYDYNNRKWLASFRPVPATGWGIIVQQPLADIYGPIEKNMATISSFFLVSFAICILVMIISIRYLLAPLTKLATALANRDLLQPSHEYANDEIGQLAATFSDLFAKLQHSLIAQEKSAAELWKFQDHLGELVEERTAKLVEESAERAQTERALLASEERLSLIISQSPLAIISWDINFNVTSWNHAAEKMFGYSADEAIGQHADFIVAPAAKKQVETIWHNLLRPAGGNRSTNKNVTRKGHTIYCDWYNSQLINASNEIIGVLSMVDDVTLKSRMEKDLFKIKKLESLGLFAGGIAHDFNNILTGILGNINLALFDDNIGDETRQRLVRAENASHQASALTHQLLTFSKGGSPVRKTTSIADLIKDAAEFVLHGNKVNCQYDFPENLWLADTDKDQISRVFQNIVLNASQSMPNGGTIKIAGMNLHISARDKLPLPTDGKFIRITIQDTGIGMPTSVLDRIFDPYFSTKQEGSGLGLAVCHSIMSKHNGHITASSEPGQGTTFTLYFPATEKIQLEEKGNKIEAQNTTPATIMVMDDDITVKEVVTAMLTQLGHKTVLAADGTEAITVYKKMSESNNPVDLIIMDLTIPDGMGGREAVQGILAVNPQARVIVSTGYSNDSTMADYKKYGFCGALSKPFTLDQLAKTINNYLAKSTDSKEYS